MYNVISLFFSILAGVIEKVHPNVIKIKKRIVRKTLINDRFEFGCAQKYASKPYKHKPTATNRDCLVSFLNSTCSSLATVFLL